MNALKYRVVIVEDEPKIRRNLMRKIDQSDNYRVVGTASDGVEAVSIIMEQLPDVVFTDIKMPKMDGLELIRKIMETKPDIHFVIISGYNEFEYAQTAMKMGVRDYLLKPVSLESLNECLNRVSRNLMVRTREMKREVLTSTLNGGRAGIDHSALSHPPYAIFLIGLGNLCATIVPPEQYVYFGERWKDVSFDSIMKPIVRPDDFWIVIDEKAPNQKFLLLSANDRDPDEIAGLAAQIQASLAECAGGLPVHICHLDQFVLWNDIWEQAQTVRSVMESGLIPGSSQIYSPAKKSEHSSGVQLVDQVLRNKVSAYIQSGQTELLKGELTQSFRQWEAAGYPQRLLEKVTMHVIQLVHLQTGRLSEAELFAMESEFYSRLAVSAGLFPFFDGVWELIERMVSVGREDEDTLVLAEQVVSYLKLNFTKDINLEELAQKFHFTSSYLSKVFKKHYHETPLKYIIKLRIEEAKRLMIENPQREVGIIAEILGYHDQHYFSRIFKNATGMSPTEYRDRHS